MFITCIHVCTYLHMTITVPLTLKYEVVSVLFSKEPFIDIHFPLLVGHGYTQHIDILSYIFWGSVISDYSNDVTQKGCPTMGFDSFPHETWGGIDVLACDKKCP